MEEPQTGLPQETGKPQQQTGIPQETEVFQDEKKELLRREEIKTMEKDISHLREMEAQKEKERLIALEAQKEKDRFSSPPPSQPREETMKPIMEKPPVSVPQPPQPAKRIIFSKKVLINILIILVILLIVGGVSYWYLTIKKQPAPEEQLPVVTTPTTTATSTPTEEATSTPSEKLVPQIIDRFVQWGYRIPSKPRLIDTIIILSAISPGENPYSLDGVIQESKKYRVSPHYLITREGIIYRLVPDEYVAYHAGVCQMPDGSRKNIINNFSIGIELIYAQTESPNDAQFQSLTDLVAYLKQQYNIPSKNILGHNQITPERKTDPWNFDWVMFNEALK